MGPELASGHRGSLSAISQHIVIGEFCLFLVVIVAVFYFFKIALVRSVRLKALCNKCYIAWAQERLSDLLASVIVCGVRCASTGNYLYDCIHIPPSPDNHYHDLIRSRQRSSESRALEMGGAEAPPSFFQRPS